MESGKKVLIGMTAEELKELTAELGMPKFTAGQIAKWLYTKHVKSIDEMTNLSKANRARLDEVCTVGTMEPADSQRSVDGTVKYLFPTAGGKFVETVFIPDGERATLCVSSQVGCKMNCLFCQTGKQGFEGNLTAGDILNQIYSLPERERLTNVVFMGQGEPMDNIDNVLKSTEILTSDYGYAWSPNANSMHSPLHEQRMQLMPAEKQMPIKEVVELLKQYDFTHQRRASFEYIVFDGVNDSPAHAREIIRLVSGLECRINLIRFHTIPDVNLHGTDDSKMEIMRDYLTSHGVFTTIRASRGQDIFAACGLLSTAHKQQQSG